MSITLVSQPATQQFINGIDRSVWNPDILPAPGSPISDEQGAIILDTCMTKVRDKWASFTPEQQAKFPNFSLGQLNVTEFNNIVRQDEQTLITLLQPYLPSDQQNTTIWKKVCSLAFRDLLRLNRHNLSSLPESFGNLTALTLLELKSNGILSFPESIIKLTALKSLDLDHNKLESLPDSVGTLTALIILDLVANNLSSLPDSVGKLPALGLLDLTENKLEFLPPSIVNCKNLVTLYLGSNLLKKLPPKLDTLSLERLNVDENPDLASDPESVKMIRTLRQNSCIVKCDQNMEDALLKLESPQPDPIRDLEDGLSHLKIS